MGKKASDSSEQSAAELLMLRELNRELGLSLSPQSVTIAGAGTVKLDGLDPGNRVLCEAYARIGALHGSQPDKVAGDILKMLLVEKAKGGDWRKIYCFADNSAARNLRGRSWLADVARRFGVEVRVVSLPQHVRASVKAAQARQVMVNRL
jgi:hypothetical protein